MTIGTWLFTVFRGVPVGQDELGNRYYQDRRAPRHGRRQRRWVMFAARPREATAVPPEWQAWLRHTTDAPLTAVHRHPWQKPPLPNLTGTPAAYRPPGHDYKGGHRAAATGDYESWTPES